MYLIESILAGLWATLFMDLLAKILSKKKLIHAFITPEELGRWFLYLVKGKIAHANIRKTPPLKNETAGYYFSHYLIGIALAGIYLFLALIFKELGENAWVALVFGILTVTLPWFWLLPTIGLGFIAARSVNRMKIIKTNLINHTNFGIGLFLWFIFFHSLFV